MAPKTSTAAKRKAPAATPASEPPAPPAKRAKTASPTKPSAPAKGKAKAVDPPPPAAASTSSAVAATSSSSAAAATVSTNTASTAASKSTTNPVFEAGNSDVLLKKYSSLQLLGLPQHERADPVSSDEGEGLGSWTEKDEDRWLTTLVQAQDETSEQTFVIDELLRWREHPRRKGFYQYRVAWQGYPIYACTWEPASSFDRETLEEFWTRKKAKPDFIPTPDSDEEVMSAHNSDTDFASFFNLDADRTRDKIAKMREAWRRDKNDLRFVKQLRREEREARRVQAALGTGPALSSSASSAAISPQGPKPNQLVIPPQQSQRAADVNMANDENEEEEEGEEEEETDGEDQAPAASTRSKKTAAVPPVSAAKAKASATASKAKASKPIPKASGSTSKTTKAASSSTAKGKGKAEATKTTKTGPSKGVEIVILDDSSDDEPSAPAKPLTRLSGTGLSKKAAPATKPAGKAKATPTNKSPPPAARPSPRRKGTKVTVPVEEDPSDGDVEDEGEDDDDEEEDAGENADAENAGPARKGRERTGSDSDGDDFFDRSKGKSKGTGRSSIMIPQRESTAQQGAASSSQSTTKRASPAKPSAKGGRKVTIAEPSGSRMEAPPPPPTAEAAAKPSPNMSTATSSLVGGVPARVRVSSTSSSPLTSLQSDSEISIIAATRNGDGGWNGLGHAKSAAPRTTAKRVRICAPDSIPGAQASRITVGAASQADSSSKVYQPMPVAGTKPSKLALTAKELAEAARLGKRATSLVARRKLTDDAIATAAAEMVEADEDDMGMQGGSGSEISAPISVAAPVFARRSAAGLIPRNAMGEPMTTPSAAGPSSSSRHLVGGGAGRARLGETNADRLAEERRMEKLRAAAEFMTRPHERKARQGQGQQSQGGADAASGSTEASPVRSTSTATLMQARAGRKVVSTQHVSSAASTSAAATTIAAPKGSYKGAHKTGPKIQRIGLVADPIPLRRQKQLGGGSGSTSPTKAAVSLSDLPAIPRKPPAQVNAAESPSYAGPSQAANTAAAGGASGAVIAIDTAAPENDLGDLWGDDEVNFDAPADQVDAPQDAFADNGGGWDEPNPSAAAAPAVAPAPAPAPTIAWAGAAAAETATFLDTAAGWDDDEPPAAAAVAPPAVAAMGPGAQTMYPPGPSQHGQPPALDKGWSAAPASQSFHGDTSLAGATGPQGTAGYAAQQGAANGAASGWDEPNAPAAAAVAPAPVPTTSTWAGDAAAERAAFLDTAAGWDDDEPPAPAPVVQATALSVGPGTQTMYPLGPSQHGQPPAIDNGWSTAPASQSFSGGPGLAGATGPQGTAGYAAQQGVANGATSGWGEPNAPAAAAVAPAPVPTTSTWAGDAAAERAAFLDTAAGWDDDEPPAPAPPPVAQAPALAAGRSSAQTTYPPPASHHSHPAAPDNGWSAAQAPPGFSGDTSLQAGMSSRAIADWQSGVSSSPADTKDWQSGASVAPSNPTTTDWRSGLDSAWSGVQAPPPRQPYADDAGGRPRETTGSRDGGWAVFRGRRQSGSSFGHGGGASRNGGQDGGGVSWNGAPAPRNDAPEWPAHRNEGLDGQVQTVDTAFVASAPSAPPTAPAVPSADAPLSPDAARKKFEEIASGWDDDLPPAKLPSQPANAPLPLPFKPAHQASPPMGVPTGPRGFQGTSGPGQGWSARNDRGSYSRQPSGGGGGGVGPVPGGAGSSWYEPPRNAGQQRSAYRNEAWGLEDPSSGSGTRNEGFNGSPQRVDVAPVASAASTPLPAVAPADAPQSDDAARQRFEEIASGWDDDLPPAKLPSKPPKQVPPLLPFKPTYQASPPIHVSHSTGPRSAQGSAGPGSGALGQGRPARGDRDSWESRGSGTYSRHPSWDGREGRRDSASYWPNSPRTGSDARGGYNGWFAEQQERPPISDPYPSRQAPVPYDDGLFVPPQNGRLTPVVFQPDSALTPLGLPRRPWERDDMPARGTPELRYGGEEDTGESSSGYGGRSRAGGGYESGAKGKQRTGSGLARHVSRASDETGVGPAPPAPIESTTTTTTTTATSMVTAFAEPNPSQITTPAQPGMLELSDDEEGEHEDDDEDSHLYAVMRAAAVEADSLTGLVNGQGSTGLLEAAAPLPLPPPGAGPGLGNSGVLALLPSDAEVVATKTSTSRMLQDDDAAADTGSAPAPPPIQAPGPASASTGAAGPSTTTTTTAAAAAAAAAVVVLAPKTISPDDLDMSSDEEDEEDDDDALAVEALVL
ncbi:unnamed protein product [Tilletia laevis]|uniref:Chromo domain-containing protein n=1 Tax=Tilletia laevis TaxID=157183 RepID=A0A9N8LNL0_9BASI|nr:unnamed protein product [Tilletia laevis]